MQRWLEAKAFSALPDERPPERRYVIMMPLPNVTGALHLGHAMDNVMQDMLIRWHRMMGDNALWQPGTDHAGIATQAVVEKRLFELEGKTRNDIGREALVERILAWKDEFQQRIVRQQQEMGCSADWDRQRFTMDPVCTAALRETFFRLFDDRLIYRGDRLVNWDCQLQTAVADDEVNHEAVAGHFWYVRYPVIEPEPGEPEYVIVATTRPETMLGDTAVACHPNPAQALDERIADQKRKVAEAATREKEEAEEELGRLLEVRKTKLSALERLVAMAESGRKVLLPLLEREMPLILDDWAKPELGTGCVKITPAHDPNDYDVWQRHADEIHIINILQPDGTLNENAGPYARMDRFEARDRVIADLEAQGLLHAVEDREVELGHSDRSKTIIEPYLSKQWFVRMGDVEGGIVCGRGTPNEFTTVGLAQVAIDAASGDWKTPKGKGLTFHPDRYTSGYVNWLAEKRDWCISRQLWWGHRIPVWTAVCGDGARLKEILDGLPKDADKDLCAWVADSSGTQHDPAAGLALAQAGEAVDLELQVCLRNVRAEESYAGRLKELGLEQDPDVLDTWFSSALWPFSTLGWPDPGGAAIDEGQCRLGNVEGVEDSFPYYYPGSCLVTARDIITNWVARMLIMGLYNHGDVPFTDCFVHAKILDGKGVTMSKSKGNGIDPVDIIEQIRCGRDALFDLLHGDGHAGRSAPGAGRLPFVRNPGRADGSKTRPHDLHLSLHFLQRRVRRARHDAGRACVQRVQRPLRGGQELLQQALERGALRAHEPGRSRLPAPEAGYRPARGPLDPLAPVPGDREVTGHLEGYRPSAAISAAREFFWGEFCDWYLELIKPRMRDEAQAPIARQVLAVGLDQVLRLLHPFVPFITEQLWTYLNRQAPKRGVTEALPASDLCVLARWPQAWEEWEDEALEEEFERVKLVISRLRELRSRHQVPPRKELPASVKTSGELLALLERNAHLITFMARLSELHVGEDVDRPKNAASQVIGDMEIFLGDVLDPEKERARLETQKKKLEKQLEASRKKLANQNFVDKAPAEVVEEERNRVEELSGEIALLEKNLQALET